MDIYPGFVNYDDLCDCIFFNAIACAVYFSRCV